MKKSTTSVLNLPEGLSTRRAAGFLLFKGLIEGPRPGTEVKKEILDALDMKYCGTVVQHHYKAGRLRKKGKGRNVVYLLDNKGRSYARKTFGLLSEKMKAALDAQVAKRPAKVAKPAPVTETPATVTEAPKVKRVLSEKQKAALAKMQEANRQRKVAAKKG